MKIAVTSQNRRTITEHAGRCRWFWVFETDGKTVVDGNLRQLAPAETLRASDTKGTHPLDDVRVLITGGMGQGLAARLRGRGIEALVTSETDPERAVLSYLDGSLDRRPAHARDERCYTGGCARTEIDVARVDQG